MQQEASIQVPGAPQEAQGEVVQIAQSFNLKELEQSDRVWSIVLAGLVHHLYYVYNTVEQESIARDRYVSHGHFTSTEFEYLIGPEKPGKQAQPGILRRAGLVVTDRGGEGQVVRTILPIREPAKAIATLFAYLERMESQASEDTREVVSIAGTSYLVPGDSEGEEGFEY